MNMPTAIRAHLDAAAAHLLAACLAADAARLDDPSAAAWDPAARAGTWAHAVSAETDMTPEVCEAVDAAAEAEPDMEAADLSMAAAISHLRAI